MAHLPRRSGHSPAYSIEKEIQEAIVKELELHTYCRDCGDDGPIKRFKIKGEEPTEAEQERIRQAKAWWCRSCMYNF